MQGNRDALRAFISAQSVPDPVATRAAASAFFAKDASINVVHPFNEVEGADGYCDVILGSIANAFRGLHRRDYIVMAGTFEGQDWVTSTGHLCGHFAKDWLGIRATGTLTYLRFGEFHRMVDGKAVESYVFIDIPELMIATGQWPIQSSPGRDRGYTGFLPGPATQDGLLFDDQDAAESDRSYELVSEMLSRLATKDEAWRPYWHDNMLWYGPAAFGSFIGIEDFAGFQVPFEQAFEDWRGGSMGGGRTRHFTRFGDGNYTCSGGWPSLSGAQIGDFLDQKPTNKMLYMRVCDWWRREGDLLMENWVFVDIPHVLLQMDYDVFVELNS